VDLHRGQIHGVSFITEHSLPRGFYYYADSFRWPVAPFIMRVQPVFFMGSLSLTKFGWPPGGGGRKSFGGNDLRRLYQ